MIISIDTGKAFDKMQHSSVIKTLNKVEMEGSFLNLIKGICNKTQRLNTSSSKIRNKARILPLTSFQ